jgi:hypothetical protein
MPSLSESVLWGLLSHSEGGLGHPEWEPADHYCHHWLQVEPKAWDSPFGNLWRRVPWETEFSLSLDSPKWSPAPGDSQSVTSAEQVVRLTDTGCRPETWHQENIPVFLSLVFLCFHLFNLTFSSDSLPGWFCLSRGCLAMPGDIFGETEGVPLESGGRGRCWASYKAQYSPTTEKAYPTLLCHLHSTNNTFLVSRMFYIIVSSNSILRGWMDNSYSSSGF